MNRDELFQKGIGRRRFLAIGGGAAAASAIAAACGNPGGGTWTYDQGTQTAKQAVAAGAAAAGTTPAAGAAGAAASAGGRPKASGKLTQIYDATLPLLDPSPNKTLVMETTDRTLEVAAGVKLNAWTFGGSLPSKVARVRQGDTINFTLKNNVQMGHSIDFHAAQTPWNLNYRTILPGEQLSFTWRANFPGAFIYHCGTAPVLEHISNGMYGAIIVDPEPGFAPAREYVLVQSELYLKQAADGTTWDNDLARAQAVTPDFVVFNGAADQYKSQPLVAAPNELIRLHVVNAGPTLFSAFHVIGALFETVYVDGNPRNAMHGIQTWTVPPGGGATFELRIPDPGQYPFVTHSFAYTGLGAVGLIQVG